MRDTSKPSPSVPVSVRFWCSREFSATIEEAVAGKYHIKSIPTEKSFLTPLGDELLLSYVDQWSEDQIHSNPVEEAKYVLAWLSVVLRARIQYRATEINNVDVDIQMPPKYAMFTTKLDAIPSELGELYRKLLSLDKKLLRQYVRSCLVYQTAISMLENAPTLAFFLLVVAVECLSNVTIRKGGKSEKFIQFISSHVSAETVMKQTDEALFRRLLCQAYYYRSGFTHGGASIPDACLVADHVGYSYLKHYVEGRETFSPGIGWLEGVVHATLLEFLRRPKTSEKVNTDLADLARERGVIVVKARGPIEAGTVVNSTKVDVQ